MVTDPVCGMRIDPDDAAATGAYEGQTYYFCSGACQAVFQTEPGPTPERITEEALASRSRVSPERIRTLVDLGILEPEDGTFARRDVMRTRAVSFLQTMGIETEDLATALASGDLTLGYLETAGRLYPRADLTHAQLSERINIPLTTLERLYVAFGLRRPEPDERVRSEDLEIIEILRVFLSAGVEVDDLMRLARVWGDSARRVAQYLPHYFHTAVEERFRDRGLADNPAFEAATREVGLRAGRSGEDLLGWLFRRHSEAFMTAHQLDHVEAALDEAGVRSRAPRKPEAAVFADLSGYTRLTEERGDEAAADVAMAFAKLVTDVAREHRGSTVKLLGDGVLLHFADPGDGVRASLDVTAQTAMRGLPSAHVGINAGRMLYDEGDYFGRTVNIAARIAGQAPPDGVYAGESVVGVVRQVGFSLRELGEFELKGLAEPVRLFEAVRSGSPQSPPADTSG
jgi:adenylate cyclase